MKYTIAVLISFSLSLTALGLDLNLSKYVSARDNVNGVLKRVGYIGPGSRVKVISNHSFDTSMDEEVLMNWLKNSGELRYFVSNGKLKKDYFYPVELIDAGQSQGVENGDVIYISLRYLAHHKGLEMVVTKDTDVVDRVDKQEFVELQSALEPLSKRVDRKVASNIKNRARANGAILQNCPMNDDQFVEMVKKEGAEQRVPAELLLSMMQVESSGRCFSVRREHNGTHSVGLFQVNTGTTSVPPCTSGQLSVLRDNPTNKDLEEIRCLENPVVNLRVAIEVLRDKYASVNSRKQPSGNIWTELNESEKNSWRKALAAYNGGQAYVFQAFRDVRTFNKNSGQQLDPNNWEHRRLFFLRKWLARDVHNQYFERGPRVQRRLYDTVLNLAYVESITGRVGKKGLVDKWVPRLNKAPVRVALDHRNLLEK